MIDKYARDAELQGLQVAFVPGVLAWPFQASESRVCGHSCLSPSCAEILGSNCGPVADRSRLADGAQECAVQCGKMYISLVNKGAVVEYDSSTTGTLLHHLGLPVVRLHRRDLLPVFLAATSESLYTDAANSSAWVFDHCHTFCL